VPIGSAGGGDVESRTPLALSEELTECASALDQEPGQTRLRAEASVLMWCQVPVPSNRFDRAVANHPCDSI
jgi:hypothetical protein